jgi:hypothetical protein
MTRPSAPRVTSRALATLLGAVVGVVLLSGSDQPVTAHPYPRWQALAAPPLSPRTDALGVRIGQRVLVLGGVRSGTHRLRDGAAYDLRTGIWHRLRTPVPVTDRDDVVVAAGVAVLRHVRTGQAASWWSCDPGGRGRWARLRHLPARLSAQPSAFGSEVYALSGRRVVVYSVLLGRWTRLPADPLRPVLRDGRVTASVAGTVVHGYAGRSRAAVADRWDGLAWHRTRDTASGAAGTAADLLPAGVPRRGATSIPVGTRLVVVSGNHAWIHTP